MAFPQITPVTSAFDLAEVRRLCHGYRALLAERTAERPEVLETYYSAAAYDALLDRLPELHAPPDGAIFLGRIDGVPAGCAMIHRIGPATCEIKRVFAEPAFRGHGLGKALFVTAMDHARRAGYAEMKLDTMVTLTEAIALYRKLGFTRCAPFYELPEAFEGFVEFYGIAL